MWRDMMPAFAEAGWRAVAPDLAGMGDSPPDPPGTWERHADSIERFRSELGIERCVPVLHDWGGLIGLRWACEQPAAVEALVISASGFFPDGKWHGMAQAMRTPGTGEELVAGITRERLAATLGSSEQRESTTPRSASTSRPSPTSRAARVSSTSIARGTSKRSRPSRAGWPSSACPCCSSSAARIRSSRRRRRKRFERELPDTELVVIEEAGPLRLGGRAGAVRRALRVPEPASLAARLLTWRNGCSSWRSARRADAASSAAEPAARRADAAGLARRVRRPGAPARARLGAAHGDRGGPAALDDPLRAARHRQDHARAAARRERAGGVRGGVGRQRRAAPRCATCSSAPSTAATTSGERTIFFLDEIHRFNKAQQDTLLPAVEEGLVVLVGATTENPYFEVNSALLSRCRIYELQLARGPSTCSRCCAARSATSAASPMRRRWRTTPSSSSPRARRRRPHGAVRARAGLRDGRRGRRGHAAPWPRTRSSAAPCSTTRGATATTT